MRFTCLDFETANRNYESVCEVGIALFEKRKIIDSGSWLVRPHKDYFYFEAMNTMIHGITERDVSESLEFDEIYRHILPFFKDAIIVAHNAYFDMTVLRRVLTLYDISFPEVDFLCTYQIARKTWKGLENYKLDTICKHLGHDFRHHDAKEDAIACGTILSRAMVKQKVNRPMELAEKIGIKIGRLYEGGYKPCSISTGSRGKALRLSSIVPQVDKFSEDNQLYQKKVVFTGILKSMSRMEAAQIVVNIGGRVGDSISKDTNFLVMGIQDYSKFVDGKESNKTKKAKEMIKNGRPIQIIDEDTFLKLLKVDD